MRSVLYIAAPLNRPRTGSNAFRPRKGSVKETAYREIYGDVGDTGDARVEEVFNSPKDKQKRNKIVRFETASDNEWADANDDGRTAVAPRRLGTTSKPRFSAPLDRIQELVNHEYDEPTESSRVPSDQHMLAPRERPEHSQPDPDEHSRKKRADLVDNTLDADAQPAQKDRQKGDRGRIKKVVTEFWGKQVEKRKIKKAKTMDFGRTISDLERVLKKAEDNSGTVKGRSKRRELVEELRRVCKLAAQNGGITSEAAQVLEEAIRADDEMKGSQWSLDDRIAGFKRAITDSIERTQEELEKDPERLRRLILEQDKSKGKKARKVKSVAPGYSSDQQALKMHSRMEHTDELLLSDDYGDLAVLDGTDTTHTSAIPGAENRTPHSYNVITPFGEVSERKAGPTHDKMLRKLPSSHKNDARGAFRDEEVEIFAGFDGVDSKEADEEFGGFSE